MTPFLTRAEERELIQAGQAGCHESRNRVIMNFYPMLRNAVHRRVRNEDEWQDVINYAISILADRFHKFSLAYGTRYSTYAMHWVNQAISRYLELNHLIHIPAYLSKPESQDFKNSREEFRLMANRAKSVNRIEPPNETDTPCFQSQMTSREGDPSDRATYLDDLLQANTLLDQIDPRGKAVLVARAHGRTFKQIAKEHGVTKQRIQQLELQALAKIREKMGVAV